MSRSSGTGSPIWFMCPNERKERNAAYSYSKREFIGTYRRHTVKLTGKTKPNQSKTRIRASKLSRQYECETCGHIGWSAHIDLEKRENHA